MRQGIKHLSYSNKKTQLAKNIDIHLHLVKEAQKGSNKAMSSLYQNYCDTMFNVAWRFLKNDFEAEEIVKESFLSAFQKLHTFRNDTSFGAWLKRIVINKSLDYIKKKKLETSELDEQLLDVPEEQDDSELMYSPEEVQKAIEALPEGFRIMVTLYLIEGYDHEEISQILNVKQSTTRTQYMRAKRKLRSLKQKEHHAR